MTIDQRQPHRAALRRLIDEIIPLVAARVVDVSLAGRLMDDNGAPFAVQCRVLMPYRPTDPPATPAGPMPAHH